MTTFTTEDRIKALEGQQTQFQTLFGALAYETPYRDESIENSCACSYGLPHAKEPLEQYPKSHT